MLSLKQMRRNAAGIAILVLLPVGLFVWLWSSSGSAAAPTVPTGASFNLTVARVRGGAAAASVARRLSASGYPAFTREVSGEAHQIIVGPYVSIDEVERVQRRLRAQGLGARMLVDESVRVVPTAANLNPVERAGVGPQIVLVGAAGRLSLVFEMGGQPQQARATRADGSLVEVEIGPVASTVSAQVWNAPASAGLVNQIAINEVDREGQRFLQARLALANPVNSQVRTIGQRVYVDLWAMKAGDARAPQRPGVARAAVRATNPSGSPGEPDRLAPQAAQVEVALLTNDEYQELIAPAVSRLQAIEPFVAAAVTSPSADVLIALAGSLANLHAVLAAMEPPAESGASHAALVKNAEGLLRIVRAATPSLPPSTPPQP